MDKTSGHKKGEGAWIPWDLVEKMARLAIRRQSEWRVLFTVLSWTSRYAGNNALLTVQKLASFTGLSERTVKSAVASLVEANLLVRPKRYASLNLGPVFKAIEAAKIAPTAQKRKEVGGENIVAPSRCKRGCTWPTCLYVSSLFNNKEGVFSRRQLAVIRDVICECSHLAACDAGELIFPISADIPDDLRSVLNYNEAIERVIELRSRKLAGILVRLVLRMRDNEQIQGSLLQ